MAWYEGINFYSLTLLNGEKWQWWTTLSYEEAKQMIGENHFIHISSGRDKNYVKTDLNTKVIKNIEDGTDMNREYYINSEKQFKERLKLVKKIRESKQPFFVKHKIKSLENYCKRRKIPLNNERREGSFDPLMRFNEEYLRKLLSKCKEKRPV